METLLPQSPVRYFALINNSFKLYRASFKRVIWLALIMSFIIFIPRLASVFFMPDLMSTSDVLSVKNLIVLLCNLTSIFFFVVILWRIRCVITGAHEKLAEDFSVGVKKLVYVALGAIVQGILFIGFTFGILYLQLYLVSSNQSVISEHLIFASIMLLCEILLVLYVAMLFYFYIPLIAIENNNPISALKHSAQLVWNHWSRVILAQLTPWFIYLFVLMVIRFVMHIDINIYFMQAENESPLISIIDFFLFALFIPWIACVLLSQMHDLEIRNKMAHLL